jgi:hypothetical protein
MSKMTKGTDTMIWREERLYGKHSVPRGKRQNIISPRRTQRRCRAPRRSALHSAISAISAVRDLLISWTIHRRVSKMFRYS